MPACSGTTARPTPRTSAAAGQAAEPISAGECDGDREAVEPRLPGRDEASTVTGHEPGTRAPHDLEREERRRLGANFAVAIEEVATQEA